MKWKKQQHEIIHSKKKGLLSPRRHTSITDFSSVEEKGV